LCSHQDGQDENSFKVDLTFPLKNIVGVNWVGCSVEAIGTCLSIDELNGSKFFNGVNYFAYISATQNNNLEPVNMFSPRTIGTLSIKWLNTQNGNLAMIDTTHFELEFTELF
jgi:hypothetical protein